MKGGAGIRKILYLIQFQMVTSFACQELVDTSLSPQRKGGMDPMVACVHACLEQGKYAKKTISANP